MQNPFAALSVDRRPAKDSVSYGVMTTRPAVPLATAS